MQHYLYLHPQLTPTHLEVHPLVQPGKDRCSAGTSHDNLKEIWDEMKLGRNTCTTRMCWRWSCTARCKERKDLDTLPLENQ
jgi:hypothetical protein